MPRIKPQKIPKAHKSNFQTILNAASNGDLALVSAIRKHDQQQVFLVCAMSRNSDRTITPVPLAEMVNGDPFEMYEDPTTCLNDDPSWDTLGHQTKMRILEAESTVMMGLLIDDEELISMVKSGRSKQDCLDHINENF